MHQSIPVHLLYIIDHKLQSLLQQDLPLVTISMITLGIQNKQIGIFYNVDHQQNAYFICVFL